MGISKHFNKKFNDLAGGLFATVTKADVGEGAGLLMSQGVDIMAWADPFFPDPSVPDSVKKAMTDVIDQGTFSHYSMPIGSLDLRQELAKKIQQNTGIAINPSRNIIITPGSDSGLLYAMMPFINEGDEVLIPSPSYPSNFLNPKLLGGVSVPVLLDEKNNYALDMSEFEKKLSSKTKMVLLTHPNNPTTTVFRKDQLEKLSSFIIKNDLILVCDQAFEDHIFDNLTFISPATIEGMWERTLTVCSISKGIGMSGFRIGYIYSNDVIMDKLYGGAVNVLGAPSTITSLGTIAALKDESHLPNVFLRLVQRRKLATEILGSIPWTTLSPIESGILAWLNVSKLGTSEEVANYILKEAKILVNEGTPYGINGEGYLRIVYACFMEDAKAREAYTRIKNALIKLGKEKFN